MAGLAGLIELPEVGVLVAVGAAGFKGFVNDRPALSPGIMTFFAGNRPVFPRQGIPPRIVVIDALPEATHHVTGFTIAVELPVMGVFLVTVGAIGEWHLF